MKLLWALRWKRKPDTFACEHFCCLWSSRNASLRTSVVSFCFCDEICGMGRGSLAKPREGLAKPSSSPARSYRRESQRKLPGPISGLPLLQRASKPRGESRTSPVLQKRTALPAPRPAPGVGHPQRATTHGTTMLGKDEDRAGDVGCRGHGLHPITHGMSGWCFSSLRLQSLFIPPPELREGCREMGAFAWLRRGHREAEAGWRPSRAEMLSLKMHGTGVIHVAPFNHSGTLHHGWAQGCALPWHPGHGGGLHVLRVGRFGWCGGAGGEVGSGEGVPPTARDRGALGTAGDGRGHPTDSRLPHK